MPSPVVIDDPVGFERREEVYRVSQSEHAGEAERHVRIAGEIEVELGHIGKCTDPGLNRVNFRTYIRCAEDDVDRRCKIVSQNYLLEHSDRDEGQSNGEIDRVEPQEPLRLNLRIELAEISDRPDDQLGEEAHKSAVAAKCREY